MRELLISGFAGVSMLLAGCVDEGLSQREVRGHDVTGYVYATDAILAHAPADQAETISGAPTVIRPASLAVVQVGEVAPPTSALERLRKQNDLFRAVSGMSGIAPGALDRGLGEDRDEAVRQHVQHLRRVARDIGADYLLIYGGTVDTINRGTPLTLLDATLIGMFVVPSRMLEAEGRASAVLVDVANGRILATTTADGADRSLTPSYGWEGNQRRQMRHLRDELVEDLMSQTVQRFRSLEISPQASAGG